MQDLINISEQIKGKIALLKIKRDSLEAKGKAKAEASANYDKMIAIALMRLEHGEELIIDGFSIKDPAKSYGEKVAKGYCSKELYAKELAESDYKSTVVQIECIQSEVNAYQSLNRHLSEA